MELDYFVRFECGPLLKLTYSSYFSKRIRFSIGCQIHWFTIQLDFTSQYFVWFWIMLKLISDSETKVCHHERYLSILFQIVYFDISDVEFRRNAQNLQKYLKNSIEFHHKRFTDSTKHYYSLAITIFLSLLLQCRFAVNGTTKQLHGKTQFFEKQIFCLYFYADFCRITWNKQDFSQIFC